MASKAKSGLSAVRQIPENVLSPPNAFAPGATSFISAIRDGKGHAEYHIGAVNDTAFTLQVQHAWLSTGQFTEDQSVPSVVDPVTGKHVAEIIAPVTKRFIKVLIDAPAPGLGANFELGIYFQPRASGGVITSGAGGGGPVVIVGGVIPGTVVDSSVDTAVAVAGTSPLPVPPAGTRRMRVQVTGGDATTQIRVRELGGTPGTGIILILLGSTLYGGADGALAALEVENVVGPLATVTVQFERN